MHRNLVVTVSEDNKNTRMCFFLMTFYPHCLLMRYFLCSIAVSKFF